MWCAIWCNTMLVKRNKLKQHIRTQLELKNIFNDKNKLPNNIHGMTFFSILKTHKMHSKKKILSMVSKNLHQIHDSSYTWSGKRWMGLRKGTALFAILNFFIKNIWSVYDKMLTHVHLEWWSICSLVEFSLNKRRQKKERIGEKGEGWKEMYLSSWIARQGIWLFKKKFFPDVLSITLLSPHTQLSYTVPT